MRRVSYIVLCLLSLIFTFLSASLRSQDLYVGTDQLFSVAEGAIVHLDGGIENRGTLVNSGTFQIYGDWQNTGEYIATNDQLIMAGTQVQELNHQGASFSRLHINNTEGISLLSDIHILQELALTSGIITALDESNVIFQEEAQILDAGRDSYIHGGVIHEGTGYRFFPVGNADSFLPLELLDARGTNPVIRVEIKEPNPEARSLDRLELLSEALYWEVQTLEGFYEGSLLRLGLSSTFDFNNDIGLVVAAAPAPGGAFVNLGQSELLGSLADGSITSLEPTDLPVITLGKTDEFSVEGEVLIPNAFAPGSPVEKDRSLCVFTVNLLPDQFVFRVFNRWGQIVYETESLDEARDTGWNGLNQQTNEPAQFGVYSYYLSGMFSSGQPIEKKGTLTLFR